MASCWLAISASIAAKAGVSADQASIKILHPPSGLILDAPGKVVIEAQAVDPVGDIRHLEFFANDASIGVSDYLLKIATIPGRPIPHRLEWNDISAGVYRVVARGTDTLGNPVESDPVEILVRPSAPQGLLLVKWGADWKYSNDGTDLGDAWREGNFDDARWLSGPAPLGYGDGDEKTLTRKGEPPHPLTAYFRQSFQVPADLTAKSLLIRLVRDDGAAVYLNGHEVVRDNLTKGPITFSTVASETTENENGVRTFLVPASTLVAGANGVAVEVHQASATSSDLSFDLEITAIDTTGIPTDLNVVSVEAVWPTTGEPSPLARIAPGRVKVSRTGDTTLPLVVALGYGGSATPGVDYAQPPSFVEIPAGKPDTEFFIQAMEDGKVEGTESVIVMLREDPSAAPLLRYRIDPEHAKVEVQINDADRVDKPTIVVREPQNGEVFPLGAVIQIEATAIAPDGYINRVEFFDGDVRIGVSEILFIVAPPDGTPIQHTLEWKGATAGDHKLTVRAGTESNQVQSEPVVISVKARDGSSLVINAPESGAVIPAGQSVEIQAVAIDSKGYISRVEFFDGEKSIGVSELAFLVAPEPGTPIRHALTWNNAPVGRHSLIAKAETTGGDKIQSSAVPIVVGAVSEQVVLAIEATDVAATEPTANAEGDPGVFTLRRVAGPKDVDLVVNLRFDGSARNGIDYAPLEEVVKMPAGVTSVELVVKPLADTVREGSEEVIVEILPPVCIEIFPQPPECYRIDGRGMARVVIRDDGKDLQNRKPRVAITEPKSGAVYSSGETLVILAEASDADGKIAKLEVFDGDKVLGSAAGSSLKVEWTAAEIGLHRLSAVAIDDQGESGQSGAVVVFVRDLAEQAFVKRHLPPAYLPGSAIEVHLLADPPRGGGAWTIEDAPPAGWVVSAISDEGAFDAVHGRVKFGPFTDGKSRDLHYQVTAAQGATGAQKFTGSSSYDGKTYPVVGDDAVEPAGEYHPADSPSTNKSISADELTAYASAWIHGEPWGTGVSSVPLSYVVRAGFLWKSGEAYAFDPTKGGPPECWVPASAGASAMAAGSKEGAPSGLVAGARRKSPADWKPGQPGRVEIELRPPTGALAWAVEETVPAGWRVSLVSDDGVVDAQTGRIRWGLFYGTATRVLAYEVTPPGDTACTGHFSGEVSFDGATKSIDGVVLAGATDDRTRVRIIGSRRGADGKLHLDIEAAANQVVVVEGSSDLKAWEEVDAKVFTGEEIPVEDPSSGGSVQRYYRLRPVDR